MPSNFYIQIVGLGFFAQRKVEQQVKVLIKNLAIFFLFPSKQCYITKNSTVGIIMQNFNHAY